MDVSAGFIFIDVEWNELKEPICNGFDNGFYWFKLKLEALEDNIDYWVLIEVKTIRRLK